MVTVGMNYEVLPGKERIFEEAFANVIHALESAEGHNESHLYRDVAHPGSYLIVSDWNSKDAFIAFIRSDEFKAVTTWGKEQILAGRPKHQVYDRNDPAF